MLNFIEFRFCTTDNELPEVEIAMISAILMNLNELVMNKFNANSEVLPVVAESMKELCLSGSALMRAGLPMSFLYEGDSIMLRVRAEGE